MKRSVVRLRSDGLVLIRPRRLTDSAVLRDVAALLALLASFSAFSITFSFALVEAPFLVAVLGTCLAAGLWGAHRASTTPRLSPVPAGDPPPRRIA